MAGLRRLAFGALLTTALGLAAASSASAAPGPAAVRFGVEGVGLTLIPQQTITTTSTPVERAGITCSGTSAGGALETAAGGAWDAAPDPSGNLMVTTILGATHPAVDDPKTWVLTVNSVPVTTSPCALELNPGDVVLYYASSIPADQIAPTCRTNGRDGFCGSSDRTGPVGRVTAPREKQVFSARNAPTLIGGRVDPDPSGLADIRLRITRTRGTRCHFYSGIDETFLKAKQCGATGNVFFSIAQHTQTWSYLMPRRFTPGRYTVDVQAVDELGNVTVGPARGIDRIVFTVR